MQCKNCSYPLWSLAARHCPECGTEFKPTEFEFVPNSVQFCCPHCGQDYYGTDRHGHLVPKRFRCVKCQQPVHMDEMVLLPTSGVAEELTRGVVNPWIAGEGSTTGRYFRTVGMVLTQPQQLMQATPVRGTREAINFAFISALLFLIVGVGPLFGLFFYMISTLVPGGAATQLAEVAAAFLIVGAGYLLGILVSAYVAHFALVITGGTKYGSERTVQAMCYASGCQTVAAVPLCGPWLTWISGIWMMTSGIAMVKEAQQVSGLRAFFAVVGIWIILAGVVYAAVYLAASTIAAGLPVPGTVTTTVATPTPLGTSLTAISHRTVHAALLRYVRAYDDFPQHPAELLDEGLLQVAELRDLGSVTELDDRLLGEVIPTEELIRELPEHVTAHRVGDIVFVYHGIRPEGDPDDLWLAIISPDPADQPNQPYDSFVRVVTLGSEELSIARGAFAGKLREQNRRRRSIGLAPLTRTIELSRKSPVATADGPVRPEDSGDTQ